MKIALAPDLHCFYNNYGNTLENGMHTRFVEWQKSVDTLLDECIKRSVSVAVFPGDFFVSSRPTPFQVLSVANIFKKFEENGIKVIGIPGNHDISFSSQKGPCDLVAAMGKARWSCNDFSTLKIGDVGFGFLPFVKNPALTASNPGTVSQEISNQLIKIARGLRVSLEDCETKVLIGHWTIQGALSSSGHDFGIMTSEVILPRGDLEGMGWDAIMFGHIHKAQMLSANPFIAYSGCIQRIDFGEEDDIRGFFIFDSTTKENEWVPLPAQVFKTISHTINTDEDIEVLYDVVENPGKYNMGYENTIVQVKFSVDKYLVDKVDCSRILETLKKNKAFFVAGVYPNINQLDRSRDVSLTETLSPIEALGKWLDVKEVTDKDLRNGVMEEAKKMLLTLHIGGASK